jgi:lysophospholipase L1-like esterase
MKNKDFIFFGDSICVGQWVDISKVWVHQVAAAIHQGHDNPTKVAFHNRSINGNTTRQALERMHFDCLSHKPYGVLIQFGLNDCHVWETDCGHPRVSEQGYKANLIEMIERCRHHSVKHIILNSNHPTTRIKTHLPNSVQTYEERNIIYNAICREVAKEYDNIVNFVDINKLFLQHIPVENLHEYLLEDEIHLSQQGHDFYFAHFYPIIRQVLAGNFQKTT